MHSQVTLRRILTALIFIFVLTGIAYIARHPRTLNSSQEKGEAIEREPQRIVSLAPSNTEILFALGLDSKIVGVSTFCNYPAAALEKPKVGDMNTNLERVLALKPDLVVAHGKLNDGIVPILKNHGINVLALDPQTIDEVAQSIILLGGATNRESAAREIAGRITDAKKLLVDKKREMLAGTQSKPRVMFSVQSDPLWVAGPKTFTDEIINICQADNVAADIGPGFNQFSVEAAVARKPQIIITTEKDGKRVFSRGIWASTPAVKSGRVHYVEPDELVRPGPRLAEGIMAIARIIHPDLLRGE